MIDNHFFLEPIIIQRLREQIPELRLVTGTGDMDRVFDSSAPIPAAFVVFSGDSPLQGPRANIRGSQLIQQHWTVVIVARGASNAGDQNARDTAGPLIARVHGALLGLEPDLGVKALYLAQSQGRPEYARGRGYFPVRFATEFTVTKRA
jgi:hypothetical protein